MLTKQTKIIYAVLFLAIYTCTANANYVQATIHFNNDTDQQVVKTMEPYLDNFSRYTVNKKYLFSAPKDNINAHESSTAQTAYTSQWSWYGMSQYAYNYAGRSPNYGCFITEVRLNGTLLEVDHNIVIASYRQDPAHTDDYLMCTVDRNANTKFTVRFKSTKKSTDSKLDDTKRYSIDDQDSALKHTSYYSINKPIPLWTDSEKKQTLVINPDASEPTLVASDSLATTPPKHTRVITIINNTNKTLVAGSPLLEKFSRLNKDYYVNQPAEIKPGETQKISVAASDAGYFSFARLNYHLQGDPSEQVNGCYITIVSNFGNLFPYDAPSVVASSPDAGHPLLYHSFPPAVTDTKDHLACITSRPDEVLIFDNGMTNEEFIHLQHCSDIFNCISYYTGSDIIFPRQLFLNSCLSLPFKFPIDPVHDYCSLINRPFP